jgi:two-component system NarL family response regulator
MSRLSILVADDHPMIRAGVIAMIASEPRFHLAAEAANGQQAIEAYRRCRPNVVLLDLRMPVCGGAEATERILDCDPAARIVILTASDAEEDILRCLSAGACSYVLKDTACTDLIHCILMAAQGKRYLPGNVAARLAETINHDRLSARELDVLRQLRAGSSNKVIGASLRISESTVKFHVRNIFAKLNASNRLQAVTAAVTRGVLGLEECARDSVG